MPVAAKLHLQRLHYSIVHRTKALFLQDLISTIIPFNLRNLTCNIATTINAIRGVQHRTWNSFVVILPGVQKALKGLSLLLSLVAITQLFIEGVMRNERIIGFLNVVLLLF